MNDLRWLSTIRYCARTLFTKIQAFSLSNPANTRYMEISLLPFFWNLPSCMLIHPWSYHRSFSTCPWYLRSEPPSCLVSFYSLALYSQHLQVTVWDMIFSSKGHLHWKLLLVLVITAAHKETKLWRGWLRSYKLAEKCVSSPSLKPDSLWDFLTTVYGPAGFWGSLGQWFSCRKLPLPPFSQRLSQGGAMWSSPGVSAIPVLDI